MTAAPQRCTVLQSRQPQLLRGERTQKTQADTFELQSRLSSIHKLGPLSVIQPSLCSVGLVGPDLDVNDVLVPVCLAPLHQMTVRCVIDGGDEAEGQRHGRELAAEGATTPSRLRQTIVSQGKALGGFSAPSNT